MIITEPKWKRWVVETTGHIFTPKLCQDIIDLSKTLPNEKGKGLGKRGKEEDKEARVSTICWIPFDKMQYMYDAVNTFVQKTNKNHFGFGDIQLTEMAQVTEYTKGEFYEWHSDTCVDMSLEPPVRKLSMTLLLNDPSEFDGGELKIAGVETSPIMKQGHATIFASFLQHKVTPITLGVRRSLVMWFGGEPFK